MIEYTNKKKKIILPFYCDNCTTEFKTDEYEIQKPVDATQYKGWYVCPVCETMSASLDATDTVPELYKETTNEEEPKADSSKA